MNTNFFFFVCGLLRNDTNGKLRLNHLSSTNTSAHNRKKVLNKVTFFEHNESIAKIVIVIDRNTLDWFFQAKIFANSSIDDDVDDDAL